MASVAGHNFRIFALLEGVNVKTLRFLFCNFSSFFLLSAIQGNRLSIKIQVVSVDKRILCKRGHFGFNSCFTGKAGRGGTQTPQGLLLPDFGEIIREGSGNRPDWTRIVAGRASKHPMRRRGPTTPLLSVTIRVEPAALGGPLPVACPIGWISVEKDLQCCVAPGPSRLQELLQPLPTLIHRSETPLLLIFTPFDGSVHLRYSIQDGPPGPRATSFAVSRDASATSR